MASPTKSPYGYQVTTAKWLAQKPSAICAHQVGVGKTFCAILAADIAKAKRILVICPGIARENWCEEFEACQTVDRLVAPIMNTKRLPVADVLVVSFSLIRQLKVLKGLLQSDWDCIIIDEAHYAKNPNAIQTRAIYGNGCNRHFGLASKAKHVWLLSGTLMPNNPSELWSHLNALFPELELGTINQFIEKFCVKRPGTDTIVGINKQTQLELVTKLRPHVMRYLKGDVLPDLPPLTFGDVVVRPDKLPPRSTEVDEIETVLMAAFAKAQGGGSAEAIRAISEADQIHIASLRKWTGIAKAPAVAAYLLEELENGLDKVVIFAIHRDVIKILQNALPDSVAITGDTKDRDRKRYIDAFQGRVPDFNPRVLIANMDIASTALTLTASCNVVFAESSWVPKDLEQAAARCHRNGQTRPVLARVFSLKGSVDEQVTRTLVRKIRTISEFNQSLITKKAA
jgi:SWI/SNF-related matrix-associated actin-dependent regulator 1 of chromatin subfamily A